MPSHGPKEVILFGENQGERLLDARDDLKILQFLLPKALTLSSMLQIE